MNCRLRIAHCYANRGANHPKVQWNYLVTIRMYFLNVCTDTWDPWLSCHNSSGRSSADTTCVSKSSDVTIDCTLAHHCVMFSSGFGSQTTCEVCPARLVPPDRFWGANQTCQSMEFSTANIDLLIVLATGGWMPRPGPSSSIAVFLSQIRSSWTGVARRWGHMGPKTSRTGTCDQFLTLMWIDGVRCTTTLHLESWIHAFSCDARTLWSICGEQAMLSPRKILSSSISHKYMRWMIPGNGPIPRRVCIRGSYDRRS